MDNQIPDINFDLFNKSLVIITDSGPGDNKQPTVPPGVTGRMGRGMRETDGVNRNGDFGLSNLKDGIAIKRKWD